MLQYVAMFIANLSKRLREIITILDKKKGATFRILLSFLIGVISFQTDESLNFDKRFNLRGEQKISSQIKTIYLHPHNVTSTMTFLHKNIINVENNVDLNEDFYWNEDLLTQLIFQLLKSNPKKVIININFSEIIFKTPLKSINKNILLNPKVYWVLSENKYETFPIHETFLKQNPESFLTHSFPVDTDGIVRRFSIFNKFQNFEESYLTKSHYFDFINFRGPGSLYESLNIEEILNTSEELNDYKDKTIILGASSGQNIHLLTPLGLLNKTEVLAQALDTQIEKRWIHKFPQQLYFILLLALTFLAVHIISRYPITISWFVFLWIGTLNSALSAWIFDSYYIWLPVFTPWIILITVWIIFIGNQVQSMEKSNFLLHKEQENKKEIEQLKNNFVSLISHDLKTPIAKISGLLHRIEIKPESAAFKSELSELKSSTDELHRYIKSILNVLRVEAQDLSLNKEVNDINEVIESAIKQMIFLANTKNIQIETSLEPLFSLEFDTQLIKEVLINLIDNAIKYTPPHGKISISTWEIEEKIFVKISDNGSGIDAHDLQKIWHKFTRGSDQDLKTKGTGLGLYLVKYFIELHQGEVEMTSQKNQGTSVTFWLPTQIENETNEEPHE